jgi:hypothetical protein
MKWVQMKWVQMKWVQMKWVQMKWVQIINLYFKFIIIKINYSSTLIFLL